MLDPLMPSSLILVMSPAAVHELRSRRHHQDQGGRHQRVKHPVCVLQRPVGVDQGVDSG